MILVFQDFKELYLDCVSSISEYCTKSSMALVANHNVDWHPDHFDILNYLRASVHRYWQAYQMIYMLGDSAKYSKVLDVGGFYGAWAVCLNRMGYDVSVADRYDYFYGAFDPLKDYLESQGVKVLNLDFSQAKHDLKPSYDVVTCMAVLEHIPGAPKNLLSNINSVVRDEGEIILEVPNIGFWPKRVNLLKGISPHPPFDSVFRSHQPYCGHYREYSIQDLKFVNSFMSWQLNSLKTFNYTSWPKGNCKQRLLLEWPTNRFESCREVLISSATKMGANN